MTELPDLDRDKHFSDRIYSLFKTINDSKMFLVMWVGVALCLCAIYLNYAVPSFTAEATILLEPRNRPGNTSDGVGNSSLVLDSAQADSQIQVIRSERLLRAVFDDVRPSLSHDIRSSSPGPISSFIGGLQFFLNSRGGDQNEEQKTNIEYLTFSNRVGARRLGQSYVLEVSYNSRDAERAAKVANSIAMQYIYNSVLARSAAVENGSEYLQGRITKFKAELDAAKEGVVTGTVSKQEFPDASARVISAALTPTVRASPQYTLTFFFVAALSLLTGVLVLVARAIFYPAIRDGADIERYFGLECFGEIPIGSWARKLNGLSFERMHDPILSSNTLLDNLQISNANILCHASARRDSQTVYSLAFVSAEDHPERSLISAEFAVCLSSLPSKAYIIDVDAENSPIRRYLKVISHPNNHNTGQGIQVGVGRFVHTCCELMVVFTHLPSNRNNFMKNTALTNEILRKQIEAARETCHVVIDVPGSHRSFQFDALSGVADGVLIVAKRGDSVRSLVKFIGNLKRSKTDVYGVVVVI